jgi:hypothetical protein
MRIVTGDYQGSGCGDLSADNAAARDKSRY